LQNDQKKRAWLSEFPKKELAPNADISMKKLSPAKIAIKFGKEVDTLLAYQVRACMAFGSSPSAKSDISLLNEQVLLFAAISFEGALSDIYFAYVNKDSSRFLANKEKKIKKAVECDFGPWYSAKVGIPQVKHMSAGDLYPLLDPRGYNITFTNMRSMVAQAKRDLSPEFAAKYRELTPAQRKLGDCVKHLRNYMAHRSDSGFDNMTNALASLSGTTFSALSRSKSYRVKKVGAYLKALAGSKSRTELLLTELKLIVNTIGS
jgi:hypothetical protein